MKQLQSLSSVDSSAVGGSDEDKAVRGLVRVFVIVDLIIVLVIWVVMPKVFGVHVPRFYEWPNGVILDIVLLVVLGGIEGWMVRRYLRSENASRWRGLTWLGDLLS
ncbi:hypothetical protein [Falsarthrobacter nasiphocae]|uniref:Cobalt transporter CbtA n=1 Tax=Falsarthrobacter nasiphocae TaxID=189863 RepID=A0AAE3YJG4_9MICC|nr:hypothetical protein [Falsarthrobacter nasiphocae]MDR6892831.1 putative cobalt transporter CbtA [Falsarthrobacter nasiphocae]